MKKCVVSCGKYLPINRISREEYINAWGKCAKEIKEKAVMDVDEDITTMAVEAAEDALSGFDKNLVGVLTLASTNFPYEEKVSAGTIVEALGIKHNVLTSRHSGSALAGAEAFLSGMSLLDYTGDKYALVVISDSPNSAVSGDLDHGFGAGACALLLQKGEDGLCVENVDSRVKESLGIRYRPAGDREIKDIGVPAYSSQEYNTIVSDSINGLLEKEGTSPVDFSELVLPQVNIRENQALAKKLGFNGEQLQNSSLFANTGDTGACASFLPLCCLLEKSTPGDKILMCSYGAGAGTYSISLYLNKGINTGTPCEKLLEKKQNISYIQYLKLKNVI